MSSNKVSIMENEKEFCECIFQVTKEYFPGENQFRSKTKRIIDLRSARR